MNEEEKKETQEVPEWAQKLTESMEKVVDSLSHLSPQENPQEDPNATIEIPVPQEPPKEEPEVIPTEEPPAPQEEPKKKRKFLDWLL